MYRGIAAHTVLPMVLSWGGGGNSFRIAALVAFAIAGLLIASPAALGADGAAHLASGKAKRSKACKKKRGSGTRCKKRKDHRASLPTTPRTVTLTWDSSADVDLRVYDQNGHRSGLQGGDLVNGIPGTTLSGNDTDGFGPETFEDPSGRRVGYLVCYVSGPQANVTLVDSGKDGSRYTATLGPGDPGQAYSKGVGWGYLPIGAHC
jgi:hypothetical protein